MKHAVKSLSLALALACAAQGAHATCDAPDTRATVFTGTIDTGVANHVLNDGCTINDRILDEANTWGSKIQFLKHVTDVTQTLHRQHAISGQELARIVRSAIHSNVGESITVKVIGFNDFHGNIKAGEGSSSNPGVARFATRIKELKAANRLHAVVSAGDMIGASPLTSALFHDEPTIEAMNRIGIDFNAVGNHEFDEGKDEVLRMQKGGNHPVDVNSGAGLFEDLEDGNFAGADFGFLAANVVDESTGETLLPAYGVKDFLGTKVAFIGMTLEGTPSIVSPAGVAGLDFKDEADTVNALVPKLKRKGIESIVVLVHEGGFAAGGMNGCDGVSGPIVDIVNRLDAEVDLVVSGHTHQAYNCLIPNRDGVPVRVTSAGQYARNLTDIDLTIDTRTRDVTAVVANNLLTGTGTTTAEDPHLAELVAHYDAAAAGPRARVIGQIAATVSRAANAAGESVMGDVIADAQLDATNDAGFGEAVIAFMNPGGIRADLVYAAPGNVTYGDAFTVQPFGNSLVTMTLSGAQIETLLEQQFMGCPNNQPFNRILQVSNGFSYAWDANGPACDKIAPSSITLNGVALDPAASYRVTVNSFMADGGDLFSVLKEGAARLGGAQDLDALEAYFGATGIVDPASYPNAQARILRLN
jgi:5'-nucleotidase